MSATDQNRTTRSRARAVLNACVLALSGTASVVLGALALTSPY